MIYAPRPPAPASPSSSTARPGLRPRSPPSAHVRERQYEDIFTDYADLISRRPSSFRVARPAMPFSDDSDVRRADGFNRDLTSPARGELRGSGDAF